MGDDTIVVGPALLSRYLRLDLLWENEPDPFALTPLRSAFRGERSDVEAIKGVIKGDGGN